MNFPPAMPRLAGRALQPAFSTAIDVACEEIAARTAITVGIGLGERRHRASRSGLRVLPGLAGILVALGQDVGGGGAGKDQIRLSRHGGWTCDRAGHHLAVIGLGKETAVGAGEAAAAGTGAD